MVLFWRKWCVILSWFLVVGDDGVVMELVLVGVRMLVLVVLFWLLCCYDGIEGWLLELFIVGDYCMCFDVVFRKMGNWGDGIWGREDGDGSMC